MFENILVATDGSKHSEKAARIGIEVARLSGGKITALYVADTTKMSHLPDDMLLFSIRDLLVKEGNEAAAEVEAISRDAGVPVDKAVVEGNPADEIIAYASKNDIDLIVMGSVGRTGLDKFLLGSVAEKVIRNSKRPVLTIPGSAP